MTIEKILFNHDGAIDEYMAALLLTTLDDKEFLGSVIMNADCVYNYAMQAQWKIQKFISQEHYPILLSKARQWNPFPWKYRGDSIRETKIDVLKDIPDNPDWPPYPDGDDFMAAQLEQALGSGEKLTLLVNCPLTTLRNVLEPRPELQGAIDRLIWMGGAIHVAGNIDPAFMPPGVANPKAELNAFCDPYAIEWVFDNTSGFPIYVFPLDLTQQAGFTPGFLAQLADQAEHFPYSKLAHQSYELVSKLAFYDMWDVVTTCFIPHPEFFAAPTTMKLSIHTEDYWQGTLFQDPRNGREVQVLLKLSEPDKFYDYVLQQFCR